MPSYVGRGRGRIETEKHVNYIVHKLDMSVTPNENLESQLDDSKLGERRTSAKYLTLKLHDKQTLENQSKEGEDLSI